MLPTQGVDPLAELRDIHIPDSVSWWPPAPGWWVLGLALLITLVLVWFWRRRRRQRSWQRLALRHLEHLEEQYVSEPETLVPELSVILRRIATLYYPESAGLAGREWLEFLDRTLGDKTDARPFSTGEGQSLADAPYRRPALVSEADSHALLDLTRRWIKHLPPLRVGKAASYSHSGRELC
jgi:hypothetical protein